MHDTCRDEQDVLFADLCLFRTQAHTHREKVMRRGNSRLLHLLALLLVLLCRLPNRVGVDG